MMTKRYFTYCFLTTLLVFNLGCFGSDDDPNNPGIPNVDNPAVADLAAESAVLTQSIIEVVPFVAQGGLTTAKSEIEPWYDENCTCWLWITGDGGEQNNEYWSRSTEFQTTFFNDATPQQDFEGADMIGLNLNYNYTYSQYDETKSYSSKSVYFNLQLQATDWDTGTVTLTGGGNGTVTGGSSTGGDDWEGYYEEFDMVVSMTLPLVGCPGGSMALDTEEATFDINFNGSSTANWTFSLGSVTADSGSFPLSCGTR